MRVEWGRGKVEREINADWASELRRKHSKNNDSKVKVLQNVLKCYIMIA
jgi:hypothetical protein